MDPWAFSLNPLADSRRISNAQEPTSPNHNAAQLDTDDTNNAYITELNGSGIVVGGVAWNIDYPLETLQPIIATDGDTFSSSTLLDGLANQILPALSAWPTLPLIGVPDTVQVGESISEALALPAGPPFKVFPTVAANSSSSVNSTTEDIIVSTNA